MPDEIEKEEAKPKLATETSRSGSGGRMRTNLGYWEGGGSGYSGGGGGGYGYSSDDGGNLSRQIQELLPKLQNVPGVIGSAAIQYDGTLIANNLVRYPDIDGLSRDSAQVYATTYHSIKKFGHRELYQLACKSDRGFVYIADFSHGLLITLMDTQDSQKLIVLFKTVRLLIGSTNMRP